MGSRKSVCRHRDSQAVCVKAVSNLTGDVPVGTGLAFDDIFLDMRQCLQNICPARKNRSISQISLDAKVAREDE